VAWLTFGRLRPVHVNGVIWGAFSTLFIGLCHWVVPRLCGVRLWREGWSWLLLAVWNLNLAVAMALLLAGFNRGWEAGELPLGNVLVLFAVLVALTVQMLMTIRRRTETPLYVSLWYLIAALVWTDANLVLLMVGPDHLPGINNAAWHGLFIHYIVGLWITPAGYVLIYYFLPASIRAPIYSHRLSLIGFWSLAFFYPFVGIHHYLYSPIADWAETIAIVSSMMLIVPVWTVLQEPTHFTDFVVAHSHLTIFGTFIMWAVAGVLYVWPKLAGAPLASFRLANWGFWLTTLGIGSMALVLSAQGLLQGFMLMRGAEFVDTVVTIRPYWWVRTLTGLSMDAGLSLVVLALMKTSSRRAAA
jgi:cytochrome c oxidase cbb3-type subunit 1